MLNCKETTRLASDRLERRLALVEWFGFMMHITLCPVCRRFARQIGWLHDMFRRTSTLNEEQLAEIGRDYPVDRDRIYRALKK